MGPTALAKAFVHVVRNSELAASATVIPEPVIEDEPEILDQLRPLAATSLPPNREEVTEFGAVAE